MGIIDTHAHLVSDMLYPEVDDILARAKAHNVTKVLCICTSVLEYQRGLQLQQKYDWIDLAFGFHPTDLNEVNEEEYKVLEEALKNKSIVAIGEIGLDYHWDTVEKEVQKKHFIRQMQLANQYNVPILIHMREATNDCVTLLKQYAKSRGIMHCYSGSIETANELLKIGFYISFAGILTFKNANQLLTVAKELPSNRIFVETDSPYLAPVPYRGKRNEVAYVVEIFHKLEQLRDEKLEDQIVKNYQELFYETH